MSMKNLNNTMGIQTRNPQACSAVPQPIASPRAPLYFLNITSNSRFIILLIKIQNIICISQNTTVLTKVIRAVSTVSTACFGLYIGHRQTGI
jgi:hypothetical protein